MALRRRAGDVLSLQIRCRDAFDSQHRHATLGRRENNVSKATFETFFFFFFRDECFAHDLRAAIRVTGASGVKVKLENEQNYPAEDLGRDGVVKLGCNP